MSTIPSTSKDINSSYTVLGGRNKVRLDNSTGISLVVLNRGERLYKSEDYASYLSLPFESVISIEPVDSFYEVEDYSNQYPGIKFLIPHEETNTGQLINLAFNECKDDFVLVVWNDMEVSKNSLTVNFLKESFADPVLCRVPILRERKGAIIPTVSLPTLSGKKLKVLKETVSSTNGITLYPYDYAGLYSRKKFIELGGYDYTLFSPYWQKLDFGIRSYLWGEKISTSLNFRFDYRGLIPAEITTVCDDYRIFYLKNLLVKFVKDEGRLSFFRFLFFQLKSGGSIFKAVSDYRRVSGWVKLNKFRFGMDAVMLAGLWENLK